MYILPQIIAELTNTERQIVVPGVDFKWSSKSWTHNFFRTLEVVFGRRIGIRPESTVMFHKGKTYIFCHSFESCIANLETFIRKPFLLLSKVRVWIPVLATPLGPIPASPYLFAIALDTSGKVAGASYSYTATGSNLIMFNGTIGDLTDTLTSVKYATVAFAAPTKIQTIGDRWIYLSMLVAPATGSNTLVSAGTTFADNSTTTYTGAAQSGQPDGSNTNSNTAGTNISVSITTTADNCWMNGIFYGATGASTVGAGTTSRQVQGGMVTCDNNAAITPAGLNTLNSGNDGTQNYVALANSFAPVAVAVTVKPFRRMLVGIG